MLDFTRLESLVALLDRARACLSIGDLPSLIMGDPGSAGYVKAYERVLRGGAPALRTEHDGGRLLESFDITENLFSSHSDADRSVRHRWFSVLASCLELMGWDGAEGLRWTKPSSSLLNLVVDGRALQAAGERRGPMDLLPAVCRELQEALVDRHQVLVVRLVELMVSTFDAAGTDERCRALLEHHESFQPWCGEDGEPNPWFASRPELVWGVLDASGAERRRWLGLVEACFPSHPELAGRVRDRLLAEGKSFRKKRR